MLLQNPIPGKRSIWKNNNKRKKSRRRFCGVVNAPCLVQMDLWSKRRLRGMQFVLKATVVDGWAEGGLNWTGRSGGRKCWKGCRSLAGTERQRYRNSKNILLLYNFYHKCLFDRNLGEEWTRSIPISRWNATMTFIPIDQYRLLIFSSMSLCVRSWATLEVKKQKINVQAQVLALLPWGILEGKTIGCQLLCECRIDIGSKNSSVNSNSQQKRELGKDWWKQIISRLFQLENRIGRYGLLRLLNPGRMRKWDMVIRIVLVLQNPLFDFEIRKNFVDLKMLTQHRHPKLLLLRATGSYMQQDAL